MSCLCWLHIQLALSYLCILLYVVSFVYYVQQNIIEKKKKSLPVTWNLPGSNRKVSETWCNGMSNVVLSQSR